ncbi:MAG: serine/threonine protein kinase [Chloroflexi bacterium]|nr:serine/threonine protein kinase [Chloroflexota bacterium]MBI5704708.1 serine/threonine protein kinase [Chloroflexota bacterium]
MEEGAVLNNRYQLLERIGTGGMADVFRARDLMLERTVAIKILHEHYSAEHGFQERFKMEARAAANLSHPNIVTVHDFGFDHDQLYIVMEHIPGKDLKTVLRQRGRYPVEEAIPLIVQACAGIGYAHRAGLVHCDVKPHNMIVTPDGRLKVTDFGIARALSTIMPGERADVVWGSPQYFSPEQAAGEAPSPASDVYSLGIVLYEMITGALPFNAPTSQELARLHLESHPIPPREYVPDIPPALEEIILKVLSKEPSARYRTADQLGRVLLRFGTQRETPPTPALSLTPEAVNAYKEPVSQPPPSPTNDKPAITLPEIEIPEVYIPEIDWATIGLSLLALIAVLGLIPFWIWIFILYNPR